MMGWLNARREAKRRDDECWFQDMANWMTEMRTLEGEAQWRSTRPGALRPHPPRPAAPDVVRQDSAVRSKRTMQVVPIEFTAGDA